MAEHWGAANDAYLKNQQTANDVTGGFGAVSKVFRVMLQSSVLAVGAYLVIRQEATAGIIIAGSILTARAFAPVDLAIAHWKGFVAARQGWQRLSRLLELLPNDDQRLPLPAPQAHLSVENVSVCPPGAERLTMQDVSFTLKSGQGVGIVGPSAAGKSSLARVLVGVWQPARGKVRLDGASLDQWGAQALGRHIGYLPQDVELFSGTVAQNIARFDPAADSQRVVEAAKIAGAHELILGLREGYDTMLAGHGMGLSAGQQQRIALARALYGEPFLVVLDEPNSNLDAEGEAALTGAILKVRERGGILVVIAHRPSALVGVDLVLAMGHGRAQAFGPKDEVLAKVLRPLVHAPPPLRIVPEPVSK
jgi:ATP-binding cassette subfamily C protein